MTASKALEDRKARVLRAVVRDYIRTAEPVGSGAIVRRYRLGVSPATVRTEMAALEEMGYLEQPHTSAGRVPTDRGYRFFVDGLPRRIVLAPGPRRRISRFFEDVRGDLDEILHGSANLLSTVTGYAALALRPRPGDSRVARAELIPVGSSVVLIVVSDTGRIDKRVLDLQETPEPADLERVSGTLGAVLGDLSYGAACEWALGRAGEAPEAEASLLRAVAEAFDHLEDDPEEVFLGGMANIAGETAFDRETFQRLVETLEQRSVLLEMLRERVRPTAREVVVRIGRENALRSLSEASVVVAWYGVRVRPAGAVAVVGPTRMEYESSISSARAVARRLSECLGGLSA